MLPPLCRVRGSWQADEEGHNHHNGKAEMCYANRVEQVTCLKPTQKIKKICGQY